MHEWAKEAHDPGADAALWLRDGAPAGLGTKFELDGIWPHADGEDQCSHEGWG